MADGQTKNSALTTALAFHYQVLIGLEKCFSLEENQAIWFEKDGDVSFLAESSNESSQIEVKEYADSLTDNHENLWKTLALLHKDLKVKTSHIYSNLSDNSGMWSA
ncbi:Uncharacterised protein [Acinetobacter baumannii]|uniref:hypothetical protein n=1 Tax=Acinetobacter baumannii TaxID=470 RepID=UPI000DE5D849|nr:hypothetical protein [Acinetobacter baumannii]SSR93067.1 Uncharacterised protein [Acinetobacter baumannii]